MISAYQKLHIHIAGVQGKMKACKWEGSFSIVLYKMFPLQGYGKGTALCLPLLLRHIYDCASCAISLLPQILSAIQSLPNLHCSSSHFGELMGKYNLHVKVKRFCEAQMLKMLLQSWRQPQGGKEKKQGESRNLSGPVQAKGNFSINFQKSRLWQGRWRTQSCETGLKISYLHYFPNCTVFNYILLVTLGWHICVYFVLWFSWDDLIV